MNTKDTIIAFDLHSVIFKANIQEMLRILWQWPKKSSYFFWNEFILV
jgi:hypothetical protein